MADRSPAEKMHEALELAETGIRLMRQNLRREFPGETEAEIDARLAAWLRHRPGAEHGDGVGRPVTFEEWRTKLR